MIKINATELSNHLAAYLRKVKAGEEVAVTRRGKVIALLVPEEDACGAARQRLEAIRKESWVGDVIAPTGEVWEANHLRSLAS